MRGPLLFLPVLGAPLLHAPVLAGDLAPGLARPLDLGLTVRGRRLLGDNKTLRGAAATAKSRAAAIEGPSAATTSRAITGAATTRATEMAFARLKTDGSRCAIRWS